LGDIKQVIKNTLVQLQVKDLLATPDNYYKEFAIQSKLENEEISECKIFDDIIEEIKESNSHKIQPVNITTYSELALYLSKDTNNIKNLALILNEILAPSIQRDIEKEISKLSSYLETHPKDLLKKETLSKIKHITKIRITNDKQILKDKSSDFKKISDLMSKYFERVIIESGNSTKSVLSIKDDLEGLTISESSQRELSRLQGKLVATIHTLEITMDKNKKELLKNQSEFCKFEERINLLQQELEDAKEANELDYLTNILNRRAFDNESIKMEKKYQLFNKDYAIIFYDIDHFKKINDTYGHNCGDAILRTFAGILKNLSRDEDIVSRYGGEEFVILLNYEKEDELLHYLERVKEIIKKSEFNYKEYRNIDIKFCAGLARRKKYKSFEETLDKADHLLYEAKNNGRDKIILDNGIII